MSLDHDFMVMFAQSWGLFYLIALSIGVLIYALRPSKRDAFERAANSILDEDDEEEDRPCQ